MPAISEPSASARDLALQTLNDLVKGRVHVPPRSVGPQDRAQRVAGDFNAMAAVDSRVPLLDDLDFKTAHSRLQPPDLREFVLCRLPDLLGDSNAPALEDHVHARPLRLRRSPTSALTDVAVLQPG
ncbi:MAG TPA: hypothetical protein VHI54_09630 [Actinomycetota bacterium]|nr:hypothetical protein [Actinomycetota bacterium]